MAGNVISLVLEAGLPFGTRKPGLDGIYHYLVALSHHKSIICHPAS